MHSPAPLPLRPQLFGLARNSEFAVTLSTQYATWCHSCLRGTDVVYRYTKRRAQFSAVQTNRWSGERPRGGLDKGQTQNICWTNANVLLTMPHNYKQIIQRLSKGYERERIRLFVHETRHVLAYNFAVQIFRCQQRTRRYAFTHVRYVVPFVYSRHGTCKLTTSKNCGASIEVATIAGK